MYSIFIKHLIVNVFCFLIYGSVLAEVPDTIEGTKKVTAEELIDIAEINEDLIIIDARKAQDRSGGYIEGSISLTDIDTNENSLAEVIPTKDSPVIFYCNGVKCGRSANSAIKAISLGYSRIYWFRGGWEEWTNKGLPVSE
jgi:rhodanese-related sulfurtransferase